MLPQVGPATPARPERRSLQACRVRDVAVKVLPLHLSENVEARARFEAEARAISAPISSWNLSVIL